MSVVRRAPSVVWSALLLAWAPMMAGACSSPDASESDSSGSGGVSPATGGATPSGGAIGTGGAAPNASGGAAAGTGGAGDTGGATSSGGTASSGGAFTGTCTTSASVSSNASGSGPHEVVVETNSDPGINEGTIFRPADLGGDEKYPIFVWGEGACSKDGLSNAAAMAEIASHGYFVIADGTPNGEGGRAMDAANITGMAKPLIAYIDWALAENDKPCSAYYGSLDATKISANGFSCGGLMAEGTAGDPRITTWGITSSGMFSANQAFYETVHTPVLFVEGGASDQATENGRRDYQNISALGFPSLFMSKNIGHGGDLFAPGGGDFTKIILAWSNWWLKGDETATGKGLLVGASCPYCSNGAWEVMSKNLP